MIKIEVKIDPTVKEDQLILTSSKWDHNIENARFILERELNQEKDKILAYKDEKIYIVDKNDVYRIYTQENKVVLETEGEEFTVKERLFKLEECLGGTSFLRISKSEIINLDKIYNFDLSLSGTICVNFKNKKKTYVSRRYVKKIKERLGI